MAHAGPRRAPGAHECQQPVSKASAAWALTVITPQVSKWVSSDLSVASSGPATSPKESNLWLWTRCQHAVAVASSVISDCQIQSGGGWGKQYLWFILYSLIKYRTIVWIEGQRSIPVEWLSCLYKALRNCAANSTHPSQLLDPQMGPKCDLNYSPLIDAAVLQSKGDKTWEQFLFLKIQLTLEYFPCCRPTLQGQEVFFALGTKTFPITSAALLCNLRENRVWYRDNWGERRGWHLSWHRPLGASVGEPRTSATWEKWSPPKDYFSDFDDW